MELDVRLIYHMLVLHKSGLETIMQKDVLRPNGQCIKFITSHHRKNYRDFLSIQRTFLCQEHFTGGNNHLATCASLAFYLRIASVT